jgi:hypothetical protein
MIPLPPAAEHEKLDRLFLQTDRDATQSSQSLFEGSLGLVDTLEAAKSRSLTAVAQYMWIPSRMARSSPANRLTAKLPARLVRQGASFQVPCGCL